jgi:thiamine biosynthesis lipoprotein
MTIKTLNLMNGEVEIDLYEVDEDFVSIHLSELYAYGLKLQKIFNFFDPNSELSKLNKKRELDVSEELLYVIKTALEYCKKTDGKYDISLGKQILQRKEGKETEKLECSYQNIVVDGKKVMLNHPDVMIDLGSIAKGYIADKMVEYLKELGVERGFIDARGDMVIFGEKEEIVQIQHPRDETKRLFKIRFKEGALATSGDYKQFYGDHDKSHIVGGSEFASVTVLAENLTKADAAATCIFVIGKKEAEEFAKENKIKALCIGKDLKTYFFNNFEEIMVRGENGE